MRGFGLLKHIASWSNRISILHSNPSPSLLFLSRNCAGLKYSNIFRFYSTSDSNDGNIPDSSDDEFTGRFINHQLKDKFRHSQDRSSHSSKFSGSDEYDDHQEYDQFQHRTRGPTGRFRAERFGPSRDYQESFSDFGSDLREQEWNHLEPFEKNFYVEHEEVASLPEAKVEEFYAKNEITVKKGERMRPILNFSQGYFPEPIQDKLNQWSSPTSIQSMGWPLALSGHNMVGIAQTGSGKTLGFILPALIHIRAQKPSQHGDGPIALVLAPTRELAIQIEEVARDFGRLLGVRTVTIYGGASKQEQAYQLRGGAELVIATPGRLTDFLLTDVISLRRTTYTVLDEADRMLDMGFEPQIRKILSQVRPDRQMLMWSATWPREIQKLAKDYLGKDFTHVTVGAGELRANPDIEQAFRFCKPYDKLTLLEDELLNVREQIGRMPKTLVFCATKRTADMIEYRLYRSRIRAQALHGDKSQDKRDYILRDFKQDRITLLVATDVASRGIDVSDIDLVINYDFPNDTDTYIHRIGRTGRAGNKGKAICFLTEADASDAQDLIQVVKKAGQEVPEELNRLATIKPSIQKKKWGQNKPFRNQSYNNRNQSYNNRNNYYRHHDFSADDEMMGGRVVRDSDVVKYKNDMRRNGRHDFSGDNMYDRRPNRYGGSQRGNYQRNQAPRRGRPSNYDDDWW